MEFKGSQSEKNVLAAFAGESQARNRYTYYAQQARKEGHAEIAELFEKMAQNEMEHAKVWYTMLYGGYDDTLTNLQQAALDENVEWRSMYPDFAKQARAEGFDMLAHMFERIAAIENDHEHRFLEALLQLKAGITSEQPQEKPVPPPKKYRCMFCGNMEDDSLDVCPLCDAIAAFEPVQ